MTNGNERREWYTSQPSITIGFRIFQLGTRQAHGSRQLHQNLQSKHLPARAFMPAECDQSSAATHVVQWHVRIGREHPQRP